MKQQFESLIKNIFQAWDQWWFAPRSLAAVGLFRVVLTGVLFYMGALRSFHLDYYTNQSWIPRNLQFFILPESFRAPFTWFFWPDAWGPVFHILLLVLLFLAMLGIGNRITLLLAWVIQFAFIQRNYAVVFGADHIGTILLFLLALTNCFSTWSILNLVQPARKVLASQEKSDFLGSAAMRLVQIQMVVIYCYTGLEKLKGGSWWDGTALWNVLANPQQTVADFTFIKHFPLFITGMTFFTIIWEVFWPAAMMGAAKVRRFWLALGVMFHLGIGLSMGLMVFSLVMISTYLLFLTDNEFDQLFISNLDRAKKKLGLL